MKTHSSALAVKHIGIIGSTFIGSLLGGAFKTTLDPDATGCWGGEIGKGGLLVKYLRSAIAGNCREGEKIGRAHV